MPLGEQSGQDPGRADGASNHSSSGFAPSGTGPSSPLTTQQSHPHGRSGEPQKLPYSGSEHGLPGVNAETADMSGSGLSMGSMAASLPNYRANQAMPLAQNVSRLPPGSIPNMNSPQHQQHPPMHPFAGQTPPGGAMQNHNQAPQYMQAFPHMQQSSIPQQNFVSAAQHQPSYPGGFPQQPFPAQPFPSQQQPQNPAQPYMYYAPGYGQMSPTQAFQGPRQTTGTFPPGAGYPPGAIVTVPAPAGPGIIAAPRFANSTPKSPIPSAPRGPPRKPRQSGYALWVGNLPPGALVQDLKDHFSREATDDIESVFLISKSNCAFVNYRTETACAAAMTRFHDSRFQGVRLVCRYRSANSSPAAGVAVGSTTQPPAAQQSQSAIDAIAQNREVSSKAEESMRQQDGVKVNEKYFVVKSLTVEDLELSARNGIWATQAHNEEALNKAFESVDNVYLVFSANKSGEYFGYARMVSPIDDESASKLDWKPRQEVIVDDPELPRSIPTPATETAPKGRIIDDSARGTIFWEIDSSDDESDSKENSPSRSSQAAKEPATVDGVAPQTFGRPFKIEWVSTDRLPFYRTRGLRNPWNGNRDVKIARDGTELETNVGRRLVQMFHRGPGGQPPLSPTSPGMADPSMAYQTMPQY